MSKCLLIYTKYLWEAEEVIIRPHEPPGYVFDIELSVYNCFMNYLNSQNYQKYSSTNV